VVEQDKKGENSIIMFCSFVDFIVAKCFKKFLDASSLRRGLSKMRMS
jgi:hypothetical protein